MTKAINEKSLLQSQLLLLQNQQKNVELLDAQNAFYKAEIESRTSKEMKKEELLRSTKKENLRLRDDMVLL